MLLERIALFALSLAVLPLAAASPSEEFSAVSTAYAPRLERNLKENIVAFWLPRSIDKINGGYFMRFDADGAYQPGGAKMIVTQARMVWLFSRLARAGYGDACLPAAETGFRFLRDRMWDAKNGGFYWEVDETGRNVLNAKKHLYGQAFALYALSEYYLASRKPEALELATRLFDLMEEKARDARYGGYVEYFNEDWTAPPPDEKTPLGDPARFKLMNTHLHLMEAMTAYFLASRSSLARERLLELIAIQSNAVVRKNLGGCSDKYERDWTPRLEGAYSRVSYGHDLENIWLLTDACLAAGISPAPYLDLFKTLFDTALKYGYDRRKGGFYDSGPFRKKAESHAKTWWVQAEAVVSALTMYRLTRDPLYLDVFRKTYDFIDRYQTDWKHGEWYGTVAPNGQGEGDKADAWKAGYHNGRAMIESLALLKEIEEEGPP
jgi:mannobiose 2-epimerase